MIDKETAIEVRGVSKRFIIQKREDKLKHLLIDLVHGRQQRVKAVQALKDISFSVKKGEFFGVIGRNGSGKSTLLKVLAGVYSPDVGEVQVNGRLTPFIELGVGFNPELSGRDNIFLNGALLGFSHKEMEAMYDSIVRFAELENFMDQRLKNYSSGMQVRLAFSIAVQSKADILLIDEVLAVGDANFQQKCLQKFHEFKKQGKTIVFVSHAMEQIEKFCDRVAVLDSGEKVFEGDTAKAVNIYDSLNQENKPIANTGLRSAPTKEDKKKVKIESVVVQDKTGKTTKVLPGQEDFSVSIKYSVTEPVGNLSLGISVCESENQFSIIRFNSDIDKHKILSSRGTHTISIHFENDIIFRGRFYIITSLYQYDKKNDKKEFLDVYNGNLLGSHFLIKDLSKKEMSSGLLSIRRTWK